MGFFQDLKEDLSLAVNELLPEVDKELENPEKTAENEVNTMPEEIKSEAGKPEEVKQKEEPKAAAAPVVEEVIEEEDDSELVAVIAAAVAATSGKSMNAFVVRSIVPSAENESEWAKAGRMNLMR